MLSSIIDALGIVFLLWCVCFLCFLIFQALFKKENQFALVLGFPEDSDLAETVFVAYLKMNFFSFIKKDKVVVFDFGLSQEIKNQCINAVSQDGVIFIKKDDFQNIDRFLLKETEI